MSYQKAVSKSLVSAIYGLVLGFVMYVIALVVSEGVSVEVVLGITITDAVWYCLTGLLAAQSMELYHLWKDLRRE